MNQRQQKLLSSKLKQPTDKPVLLDAIDITLRTIEGRGRLYRNLVVAVSVVSILSVLSAVLLRQWLLLAGLIILVPLTGGFLFVDSHLVLRWRTGILEMARLRDLNLASFLKTISGFRQAPVNSLKAMLATLSPSSDVTEAVERKNAQKILVGTGLLTLALICLIGGACRGSVTLLLLGVSLVTLVVALGRR